MSVFSEEDTEIIPKTLENQGSSEHEELEEISIREKVILEKLMGLKLNKSPKADDLHPRVLKEVAVEIVDTLVVIFPNSIDSGMVAADW